MTPLRRRFMQKDVARRRRQDRAAGWHDLRLRAGRLRPRMGRLPPLRHRDRRQDPGRNRNRYPTRLNDTIIMI